MAALSSVISVARELAGTDSNGLTDALSIDFANYASMKMRKMLIDKGVDAAPVQEATRSITDGVPTYLYPSDMFYVPKMIEVNWFESVVTTAKYVEAGKYKESNSPENQSLGWLRINRPASEPLIDYRGDYYELLPTPNATTWGGATGSSLSAAIHIFYYLQPVLYVATSDTLNDPEALDYFSFAELIKDVYFYSIGRMTKDELETAFGQEVGRLVHTIQGDGMNPIKSKSILTTGWEF